MKDVRFFFFAKLRSWMKHDVCQHLEFSFHLQFTHDQTSMPWTPVTVLWKKLTTYSTLFFLFFSFFYRSTLHSLKENSMTGKKCFFSKSQLPYHITAAERVIMIRCLKYLFLLNVLYVILECLH